MIVSFLQQAVKREVLEETGIEFQPTSLGVVEIQSGVWYRFTFMGYVTGNIYCMYPTFILPIHTTDILIIVV